ncbi:hypothetical protein [Bartonella raoultii]|nr:hypothetical protein [Bartonella raoultii]
MGVLLAVWVEEMGRYCWWGDVAMVLGVILICIVGGGDGGGAAVLRKC